MFDAITSGRVARSFRSRSTGRDQEADAARIVAVIHSIDVAIQMARSERDGLRQRLDEAIARAALIVGNDTAEYLDREPASDAAQGLLNTQISQGEDRLRQLENHILRFDECRDFVVNRLQGGR